MVKQSLLLFLLLVFFFVAGKTQNQKSISLQEVLDEALKNNSSIQIAKIDERIASAKYKETDAVYLPQVGFSYTALSTNNPLNAFGFKLQQKTITQNDFNPDLLNHPNGTPDFTTKLDVQQPLLNLDMIYMRNAALKQTEIYQYKSQRTKEYIQFEAEKAYWQLGFAYKAVNVLEESLTTAKQVKQSAENYYNQGLIQKSDVLNAEVFMASVETNLTKAKSNIANASDYISFLMNKPSGVIYSVQDEKNSTALNDSVVNVPATRADFMAMQKAIDASNIMLKSSKMSYLPKLNAFGSYQFNDASMFGFGANAYLAGIQLSWNIFSGNKTKNSIATQTIERNKLAEELQQQKSQSQLELNKTLRDIKDIQTNIQQNNIAVEQATEALRILQNRYKQGLVNTSDVLLATTQLSQQKLNYRQTIFNLQVTQSYLQLLTTTNTK